MNEKSHINSKSFVYNANPTTKETLLVLNWLKTAQMSWNESSSPQMRETKSEEKENLYSVPKCGKSEGESVNLPYQLHKAQQYIAHLHARKFFSSQKCQKLKDRRRSEGLPGSKIPPSKAKSLVENKLTLNEKWLEDYKNPPRTNPPET